MLELKSHQLIVRFPELHSDARCRIEFQRTLRIPDDTREYPLPPGLGRFPVFHVDDYADRVPGEWVRHGGVFFPMYQSEAMWIRFRASYPFAILIGAGKINAVSGEPWRPALTSEPQNYVVIPNQPWLDGFNVAKGKIRQFVAMPLGEGYTAEEQLTGLAEHGGVQIIAYPMKAEAYAKYLKNRVAEAWSPSMPVCCSVSAMGLAPGGLMRQEIYEDSYGIDAWETTVSARCFVHLLNSEQFQAVTGKTPPTAAPSAKDYTDAGLPWFEYYGGDQKALEGAKPLAGLKSLGGKTIEKTGVPLDDNAPVDPAQVKKLGPGAQAVREGEL